MIICWEFYIPCIGFKLRKYNFLIIVMRKLRLQEIVVSLEFG